MPVSPTAAADALMVARRGLSRMADHGRIGSHSFANVAEDVTRNFGRGVEGLWTMTAEGGGVPREAAHDMLISLKDMGRLHGAGEVALQRSGYMDIPFEQGIIIREAYERADKAIDLLRHGGNSGPMPFNPRAGYEAFDQAGRTIDRLEDYSRIGSRGMVTDAERAVRAFGRGTEEMWALTSREPGAVPAKGAHNLLLDVKDLGFLEGATRVAAQRSGGMNIPGDVYRDLGRAMDDARRGMEVLREAGHRLPA